MKSFCLEKTIGKLQRQYNAAVARAEKLAKLYYARTRNVYFDLRFEDSITPALQDLPTSQYDFLAPRGRENLYKITDQNGVGFYRYRNISTREFNRLGRLENQLLNAWEIECSLHWQLSRITYANPSLF